MCINLYNNLKLYYYAHFIDEEIKVQVAQGHTACSVCMTLLLDGRMDG